MVADLTIAMPQVKAGKLRVLGVTTAKRTALLPSAPPIADAVPGVDLAGWFGVFVPAGTPQEIVERLSKELLDALSKADIRKRLADVGVEVDPLGPEAFGRFVREQIERWGRLIRAAGIQPE
jgi:tripartite-type tricarboxylate transporter receptor subunit TctC